MGNYVMIVDELGKMPKEAVVYRLTLIFQHSPQGNDNHELPYLV
jgi:hypothetical protein